MRKSVVYAELFVPLTPVFCGRKDRTTMYMYDKLQKKYNWDCNLKTQSHFKKRRTAVGFWGNKRIIWATVGSSAAVFLADIDLFIGRTTNFVFVGSRYNIFCVGGRQSLNNPSNVPQSSSVLRQTVCYVCCWSVDIQKKSKFLLYVDRPSTNITNCLHLGIRNFLNVDWHTLISDRKSA